MGIARAKGLKNDPRADLEILSEYTEGNKIAFLQGGIARTLSEVFFNIGEKHFIEAEDWIQKAIKADTANDMRFSLGKNHKLYAELLSKKGEPGRAKKNYTKAIEIFIECGADGWVERYEKELASLS